ncbi:MAG TPA: LytTR family DNA-binding domain-containing protein [Longimicrobiales bacterium]|nr:LytTR family DNA-binding domain-containing protein [Longimicrobiales bacterium]
MRALIVDDEPLGRERLRMHVVNDPRIEIVGEAADGKEAIEQIDALQPDLVFLDVQMPEFDGFEVVRALDAEKMPQIIFVTAYDEYAVRAFDVNAVDYVLKPVDPVRLKTAIDRAIATRGVDQKLHALLRSVQTTKFLKRIVVREKGAAFFLPIQDVDWVEAAGNYVKVHAVGKAFLLRQSLKDFEEQLDPEQFARVHRSAILNIGSVVRIEPWSRGEYRVILRDKSELRSSRAFGQAFRKLLE